MKKPKEFFTLDDIVFQLSDKQIEDLKSVIYMAKETGEPQLAFNFLIKKSPSEREGMNWCHFL